MQRYVSGSTATPSFDSGTISNPTDLQTEESWYTYENYMMNQNPEELPQLESVINSETYLDGMSAPRIDPAHPEMTGWAMKQNRQKQKEGSSLSDDEES